MAWRVSLTARAEKDLGRLDKTTAARVLAFLRERAAVNPRGHGKALSGPLGDFWRWRVGDYRILARIEDEEVLILVVQIGHRGKIYRG